LEFSAAQTSPVDLKLKRSQQELHITWADGTHSVLTARTLRRNCPCAACQQERNDANPLRVLNTGTDQPMRMIGAQLAGNYALQLTWSDGHDTGLFDFRYLRELAADQPAPSP